MSDRLQKWSVIIGIVSGLIAIVTFLAGGFSGIGHWVGARGTVDLPATYDGETWRAASQADYQWLLADWCYPTLGDFKSSFRMSGSQAQRRNTSDSPKVDTGWINIKVYKSNHDLIRVWHEDPDMPGAYFRTATRDGLSGYENDRRQNDAGEISDGKKFLILNCQRCTVSVDGMTYDCD
ncbi:MAG: hypothetical protein R3B98_05310 [Hyphomonas sp.]